MPFRYETELAGGRLCIPNTDAMETLGKEMVETFKSNMDELVGDTPVTEIF